MNREALEAYLTGTYAVVPDRPWAGTPMMLYSATPGIESGSPW